MSKSESFEKCEDIDSTYLILQDGSHCWSGQDIWCGRNFSQARVGSQECVRGDTLNTGSSLEEKRMRPMGQKRKGSRGQKRDSDVGRIQPLCLLVGTVEERRGNGDIGGHRGCFQDRNHWVGQ